MIILGIDPGSRITGYGVIEAKSQSLSYVTSGCIRMADKPLAERLVMLHRALDVIIAEYQPDQGSVEQVFMKEHAGSALILGHARGVILLTLATAQIPIAEYAPRKVKQAIVGKGGADKVQVGHMVRVLLNLSAVPQVDAADALSVAICHAHHFSHLASPHHN